MILSDDDDDTDDGITEKNSDSDESDRGIHVDVLDTMMERDDLQDREYREMFSTSHTGEGVVIPGDC